MARSLALLAQLLLLATALVVVESFAPPALIARTSSSHAASSSDNDHEGTQTETQTQTQTQTRRDAIGKLVSSTAVATGLVLANPSAGVPPAIASDEANEAKQINLSDEDILKVVIDQDLLANQFLVSGKITRSIYDENCIFKDEIDTYTLDKWVKGTSQLFDPARSKVVLVPGTATARGDNTLEFRFVEYLCFRIPVLEPITYLSGSLELERSPDTGLITSYREVWDQDVNTVTFRNSKTFTSGLTKESLDVDLVEFATKMEGLTGKKTAFAS
mmetsp:Transcript_17593/g.40387  ORF Transcript_17593/g.40387 Transcript_17593/m.40387 type:complete len:274 (+) Transcript_17593:175-996(+)